MHPDQESWDDERMAALFASANHQAVPPDDAMLKRLREESAEVFASEFPKQPTTSTRRHRMFVLAMRGLAATVAAAVLFGGWLHFSGGPADTAMALDRVLAKVGEADTLKLEITQGDESRKAWAKQPGRLRIDNPDGTYTIAHGDRAWLVDEEANRASSEDSSYFPDEKAGVDLLALVDLGDVKREAFKAKGAAKRVEHEGRACELHTFAGPAEATRLLVEALVDAKTQQLCYLEAMTVRDGKTESIGKVSVLAIDEPVDEALFVVGDTLTEDGRIGKVTDVQGIVSVKPVMARRFTPLAGHILLKPGDWVRTDVRGANAVAMRLVKSADVTLGPGTLVEVTKPNKLRVHSGELKVAVLGKAPIELVRPDGKTEKVKAKKVFRVDDEKLATLEKDPLWLQGFEGTIAHDSIGSLVAKVEGRNVPLTVGYHKVTVDVRDQIARTVIEESFVNHTDSRLEGIFYFPLPQDASISGFGMWINNELVEADVVEKQRAREIYETILRERRDPGLLEWSGGNIFKARVFPIFAHSEKRIKITYTQVLPLRDGRYRYSYALQSEMLQQHPLRELAIDVKLASAMPLAEVSCPTHLARIDQTRHSAHVEFTAQEYTPTRDFEVVVEVDDRQSDVVLIPHRRGDDGYFMLQLTPPDGQGGWEREVLPDAGPLELLILADTSASMAESDREAQAEFLASLCSALTPEDKINLAVCDVDCLWAFKKAMSANDENVVHVRDFLADRISLGWTDLDNAFASALKQAGPKTHVIYLGDGIVTGADADPVAFSKRLRRLHQGEASLHAVAVSSSFEPVVLKTIAALGGGSVRRISGEKGPQGVALELLSEISRPGLRDLNVEFKGVQTARVYPRELPNLAAATQQILLGRYLPQGEKQSGEVIVTGMRGDEPVRMSAKVSLPDANAGNSFIPRLWARMHLDALLEQGASQAIKDEIIGLSEEYHIMTPYTSLLVLESDEDRERFKVKRRFLMRDGEKFFAEGRDNVDYQLMQKQMRAAGNWRMGIRRAVLRELLDLGRRRRVTKQYGPGGVGGGMGGGGMGGMGGMAFGGRGFSSRYDMQIASGVVNHSWNMPMSATAPMTSSPVDMLMESRSSEGDEFLSFGDSDAKKDALYDYNGRLGGEVAFEPSSESGLDLGESYEMLDDLEVAESKELREPMARPMAKRISADYYWAGDRRRKSESAQYGWQDGRKMRGLAGPGMEVGGYLFSRKPNGQAWPGQYTGWMNTIFPGLPAPPQPPAEPKMRWPADARAIAKSLMRADTLAKLPGGLRIEQGSEYFEIRRGKLSSKSDTLALVSPDAWLTRTESFGSQIQVNFCDEDQRGVLSEAFLLGRLRESMPEDLKAIPLGMEGFVLSRLDHTYQGYSVEVTPQGDDRTLLVLTPVTNPTHTIHILIDTAWHVMLSFENHTDGKITARTEYSEFVEVAGAWWAGRIERFNADGKRTGVTTQKLTALAADTFARQLEQALALRKQVQFIQEPAPSVIAAKRAIAAGKADFDDQMTMLLYFADRQLWSRVDEHLGEAERLAGDKPGMQFLRTAVLNVSRRHEEVRQRVLAEAERLADGPADDPNALFLANYLYGQASATQQANEMLALLEQLEPVYQRQPEHVHAMMQWTRNRINYLRSAGQNDEAQRLSRELAERHPLNYQAQQQYAQTLVNMGDYPAALKWLEAALANEQAQWLSYEEEQLRVTYANFLWNQGRYDKLIEFTAAWVDRELANSAAYNHHLSALIRSDRVDEAHRLMARWLKEGRKAGKLTPQEHARMQAAISHALGQGYQIHTNRPDEKWFEPLAATAVFFAEHETRSNLADQVMNNWNFQHSDACRQVRKQIAGILATKIETLRLDRISRFIGWIWPNDPEIEEPVWKRIAEVLEKRWSAEEDAAKKHQLGAELARVLSGRLGAEEHLAFLRRQIEQGPEEYRANYVQQLFDALLAQPWSADYEDEAFSLPPKLSEAEEPAVRLATAVQGLYRLTDRMVEARYDAAMEKVEHPEKLTRTELREKQIENRRTARERFADRLREEMDQYDDAMVQWLNIERLYLEVRAGRKLDKVAEECWEMLGGEPKMIDTDDPNEAMLEAVLKQRCLMTLANLASRRTATPALIDRLLGYIDRAIELAAEENDDEATADFAWKMLKWRMLVALDQPAELEKNLKRWVGVDDPNNHWRRSYGYLLAEQCKLAEAIRQFEAIETDDELSPQDYRALAGWYMVVNQREKHEQALVEVFKATDEWRLSDWLYQRLRPWQRNEGEMPAEMNPDVLRVFAALFQKAQHPSNHLGRLREFYQATRDFRLLTGLADGMVGHTAGKVYPFLQGMDSVLDEIRDEATADSLIEHLAEVRKRAETDVDHRALDLLEVQVARRASEVLNQPGPHVERALTAMRRAFKREWSDGEPRLMADFLANLGRISQEELADEQLREARILHEGAEKGTIDRLHIAHRRAQCIWYYQRHDEAIDLLEAALVEFENACDGVLPTDANSPLETFISYLEQRNHYARAEAFLLKQLEHPVHQQQVYWLTQRLYRSYNRAIEAGGDVSLGSGVDLYRAIEKKIRKELGTLDHNHRYQLVNILCDIYRTSKRKKFDGVADDLRDFGFKQLPDVLGVQTTNYQSIVSQVASTMRSVAGTRDGLAFLIERLENEPSWFRYNNQDGWNHHGYNLAYWRTQVGELGDLEPRLLAIVLKELRRDLESRQSRNRNMYYRHHSYYWSEKENDFRQTAEKVYAERKRSGAAVQYIADYLFHGLDHHDRAIEMLLVAEKEEILDEQGRWKLVDFLHRRDRFGESIPVLQILVERYPDNMNYRVYLMRAYHRTSRPAELLALLEATDKYFHEEGRWQESAIAALAHSCLENELFEQSVEYYKELIPLHQRTQPRRGIGNGTLSSYYTWLADAYAGLGNTVDAVDAACGAVISWGSDHDHRGDALRGLQRVLRNSPDLDDYVVELDKQCEEDSTENPIVRKALGMVYFDQGKYDKAIAQLELACQAQPNDTETHQKLIACYDEQKDKWGALKQLLASVQLSRRDINLYRDLGRRYGDLKQSEDAERAHTSIVEMLPGESESHALLAEIRQNQDRWTEAIAHWQQVAEIRALEPTGLLKLAAAQIHEKRYQDASETIKRLRARGWPSRFGDVDDEIRKLERQIDEGRSALKR